MQSICYKEWKEFFSGNISEEQVKDKILINTRQYAKRQITWFKNQYINIGQYFLLENEQDIDDLISKTIKLYKENE
jgi:tRNA dimethylallyltransferase